MIKYFVFVSLLSVKLFAYCVYVDCTTGVTTATTSTTTSLEKSFSDISDKLNEIDDLYSKKKDKLKANNEIYSQISLLKKEYLLKLKEIKNEIKKQRSIK